jgi:hypothetical protein
MSFKRNPGLTFLILGIAFLAVSRSGQRIFLITGVTFLFIGLAFLLRQRRDRER